eukprot:TRINITY_DN17038_c0_g1_i2.p1 TRINITY_DN17038_c0_g1~~TRINITY_DN17038_c0_g1_i2.p1  ORF type:complete len:324 (+),score=64.43 TRINITY_DN17038_c0_g1_i2:803-1774(+)
MVTSIKRARSSLWWLCLFTLMAMTMSSSLLYYAEKEEASFDYDKQAWYRDVNSSLPDAGQKVFFQSIPDTMWWALVTLTTTGYGDTYPITIGGKVIAGFTMIAGLLVVGYPITILTAVFQDVHQEYLDNQAKNRRREILKDKLLKSELFKATRTPRAARKKEKQDNVSVGTPTEALEDFANLNFGLLEPDALSEGEATPKADLTKGRTDIPTLVLPDGSEGGGGRKLTLKSATHPIVMRKLSVACSRQDEDPLVPLSKVNEMISSMEATILQHLATFDTAITTIRSDLDMIIKHVDLPPPTPPSARPPLPPMPPPNKPNPLKY